MPFKGFTYHVCQLKYRTVPPREHNPKIGIRKGYPGLWLKSKRRYQSAEMLKQNLLAAIGKIVFLIRGSRSYGKTIILPPVRKLKAVNLKSRTF